MTLFQIAHKASCIPLPSCCLQLSSSCLQLISHLSKDAKHHLEHISRDSRLSLDSMCEGVRRIGTQKACDKLLPSAEHSLAESAKDNLENISNDKRIELNSTHGADCRGAVACERLAKSCCLTLSSLHLRTHLSKDANMT